MVELISIFNQKSNLANSLLISKLCMVNA
ncbi:MAG: hypothetical protein ACI956_002478, partial [Nonlabens sp.]